MWHGPPILISFAFFSHFLHFSSSFSNKNRFFKKYLNKIQLSISYLQKKPLISSEQISIHNRSENIWEGSCLHNNDNITRSWAVTSDVNDSQGIEPGKQQEDGEGKYFFATKFVFQKGIVFWAIWWSYKTFWNSFRSLTPSP